MPTTFEQRLSAAVRAGWWTVLIAIGVVSLQWIGYATFIAKQPAWFLRLWGPDMSWARIESMVLQSLILFRLFVGAFLLVVIWGSFWSVALKRRARASRTAGIAPPVATAAV